MFIDLLQWWVGYMKSRINLQLAEKEELKLPEFGVLESKIL